jgi:hypothetical protein
MKARYGPGHRTMPHQLNVDWFGAGREGDRPMSAPAPDPRLLEITVSSRYAKLRPERLRLVTPDGDVIYDGPLPETTDGAHTLVGLPSVPWASPEDA